MTKKHVSVTTKEYTYDSSGRIVKEVIKEENYEEETVKVQLPDFKKSIGVTPPNNPYNPTITYYTSTTTDGINHNITGKIKADEPVLSENKLKEQVRKSLRNSGTNF